MSSRAAPVVEFPFQIEGVELRDVVDVLRRALGRVTALVTLPLLSTPAGTAVAGGTWVAVPGAAVPLNASDAALDQVRLVVHGALTSGSGTAELYDATAGKVLALAVLSTTPGLATGAWTGLTPFNADHTLALRVTSDAGATLLSAHAQFRTTTFR